MRPLTQNIQLFFFYSNIPDCFVMTKYSGHYLNYSCHAANLPDLSMFDSFTGGYIGFTAVADCPYTIDGMGGITARYVAMFIVEGRR